MKVPGDYYERLQYGILGIEPVFRDSLPVMRKKLIARGANWGLVSNTKLIRLRRHIGSLGHAWGNLQQPIKFVKPERVVQTINASQRLPFKAK